MPITNNAISKYPSEIRFLIDFILPVIYPNVHLSDKAKTPVSYLPGKGA